MNEIEMLRQMGSIIEPWDLFEPHLWKDKIGDSLWHCSLKGVNGTICEGKAPILQEAIADCYDRVKYNIFIKPDNNT